MGGLGASAWPRPGDAVEHEDAGDAADRDRGAEVQEQQQRPVAGLAADRDAAATLATLTSTIRYRTRFQRRMVMQRTSTIRENAEPSTTSGEDSEPADGVPVPQDVGGLGVHDAQVEARRDERRHHRGQHAPAEDHVRGPGPVGGEAGERHRQAEAGQVGDEQDRGEQRRRVAEVGLGVALGDDQREQHPADGLHGGADDEDARAGDQVPVVTGLLRAEAREERGAPARGARRRLDARTACVGVICRGVRRGADGTGHRPETLQVGGGGDVVRSSRAVRTARSAPC